MVTDSSSRRVIVVAGPNGSGKSSLTRRLQRPGSNLPFPEHYVNADEIAVDLRNCGDADPERTAFRLGRERRAECREAGVSFAYETVLSHPSGLVDLLLLRRAGFHVTLIVVTTADPEINVARVRGRVQVGGHAVPEEKIRQRYRRFHGLFPVAVERAHDTRIFDSTDRITLCLRMVDGAPRRGGAPPPYLKAGLIDVLQQRADDRSALRSEVLPGVDLEPINLLGGAYEGRIVKSLTTAFLQSASDHSLLMNDRALFDLDVSPYGNVVVRYEQGCGRIHPLATSPGSR